MNHSHGIGGLLYLLNGHLGGSELHRGLFSAQVDRCLHHAGNALDGILHMAHAGRAGHALHGQA